MADEKISIGNLQDKISESIADVFRLRSYMEAFEALGYYGTQMNKVFTQNRDRIVEIQQSIAEAVPGVRRLGGNIDDVANVMGEIAVESRRNVLANAESVEKLYASSEVLQTSVSTLVSSFADVGYTFEKIPSVLEESINYIQRIGGNAKDVMNIVVRETDQLNRFQFEGGVKGLTKMAAQASMLRFDMNETFRLADKVLDPEGAIQMASAFQRLGVAAGNLVDPFQLMNQSILDPSGLQSSLADVAKQFAFLDPVTKSFRISPEGVLTLREIEKEAGLSTGSLSKMALAASELDARLSDVSVAGLKFKSEEDKQYLANIAKMGEGGTYEVTLKDGTTKELKKLNQEEFDELIKQQREAPKTMEEIARSQMTLTDMLLSDVKAIKEKLLYGFVSARETVQAGESARNVIDATLGSLSDKGIMDVKEVRKIPEKIFSDISQLVKDIKDKKSLSEALDSYLQRNKDVIGDLSKGFDENFAKFVERASGKLSDNSLVERELKKIFGVEPTEGGTGMRLAGQPGQSLIEGISPYSSQIGGANIEEKLSVKHTWDDIKIHVDLGPGLKQLDNQSLDKVLTDTFNETKFKQYILDIIESQSDKLSRVPVRYGR